MGFTVTFDVSLLSSDTKVPYGEGVTKDTMNGTVWPGPAVTLAGSRICATFAIFTVALPVMKPLADAVIVLLPPLPGVTATFAVVEPCGTDILAGTLATLVLLLDKFTVWPPIPAGADRVRVSVPDVLLPKLNGFGVSEMAGGAATVMLTVAGALLAIPSFTINCTT